MKKKNWWRRLNAGQKGALIGAALGGIMALSWGIPCMVVMEDVIPVEFCVGVSVILVVVPTVMVAIYAHVGIWAFKRLKKR